jgi:hypothetical protein
VVELSQDGNQWREVWRDKVLEETLAAALHDPRTVRVVVPFAAAPARYVRLRQVGRDQTWYWSIAELELWTGHTAAVR